jgi:hypothetical protein
MPVPVPLVEPEAAPAEVAPEPEPLVEPAAAPEPPEPETLVEPPVEPLAPPEAPEQQPPEHQPTEPPPSFIVRGRLRRRVRYLRRVREVQLRDIGGFVLELHRYQRERPELVKAKVAHAATTDTELRALERALGEVGSIRELREPGIGGACPRCGAVHGSTDRFCAWCGEPLSGHGHSERRPDDLSDPLS